MQDTQTRRGIEQRPGAITDPETDLEIDPEDLKPRAWILPERSRVLLVLGILAALLLMVLLPPFISFNRYRRQITTSISASLGRPVHMDSVALNILPIPGFTLGNFVVSEDPAFGSEPVIQARSVKVRLRVWPLWRRRIEFSRISLQEPSVNLVHRADDRWNIESILLQASKIEVAPTAQKSDGDAPRFPYIEATGARVNVMMGLEKMPFSFTEADFALWLPQPQQWKLRLEARPMRTDTAATDTGILQVQGTLGKATALEDVPIDLTGDWSRAPLGGFSWMVLGRDGGLRGSMNLHATVQGTVSENTINSLLELHDVRRSDFVPEKMLDAAITCKAQALAVFHTLHGVDCGWTTGEMVKGKPAGIRVQAEVPDVLHPENAQYKVTSLFDIAELLNALRVASSRISPALTANGWLTANVETAGTDGRPNHLPTGAFTSPAAKLALGDTKPFLDGEVDGVVPDGSITLAPLSLNFGAPLRAILTGTVSSNGFAMTLSGPVLRSRLMLLANALPQFGDGLEEALPEGAETGSAETPIRVDLASSRTWAGGQTWTPAITKPAKGSIRRGRR